MKTSFLKNVPLATLAPLFFMIILDSMSFGIVLPILSPVLLAKEGILATSASPLFRSVLYSLTLVSFSLFMLIGSPIIGVISDKWGRKNILIITLLGAAFAYALCAVSIMTKSVSLLILGRLLDGLFVGGIALAEAAIIDVSERENKSANISMISMASALGFIIGPLVGGYLSDQYLIKGFGFATPFWVASALALINTLGIWLTFDETFHPQNKKWNSIKILKSFAKIFSFSELRLLFIIYLFSQFAWTLYIEFIPMYLVQRLNFVSSQIGIFMAFTGVVLLITMSIFIHMASKFLNDRSIALLGLFLTAIAGILAATNNTAWLQWFCVVPLCIGVGLFTPTLTTLLSNLTSPEKQGWMMGIITALMSAGWLLSGLVVGFLGYLDLKVPFIVVGISAFFSTAGMLMYCHRRRDY